MKCKEYPDKAKPIARWGRKAAGLDQESRAAWKEEQLGFFVSSGGELAGKRGGFFKGFKTFGNDLRCHINNINYPEKKN